MLIASSHLGMMAGVSPPVLEYLHTAQTTGYVATNYFYNVPFGNESADRLIVVQLHGYRQLNVTIATAKIGGVDATINQSYSPQVIQLYTISAVVPTGTSGTIELTFSAQHYTVGICVFSVKGYSSATPVITEQTIGSSSITISPEANTAVMAHITSYSSAGSTSWSGTSGVTENSDIAGANVNHSCASKLFTAGESNVTIIASPSAGSEIRMQVIGFK